MTLKQFIELARHISHLYPGQVVHVSYNTSPRYPRQHQVSFDVVTKPRLWRRVGYDICPTVLVRDGVLLAWHRDLFGGAA